MLHTLLLDQAQLQHADQGCCVLHPSSVKHPNDFFFFDQ